MAGNAAVPQVKGGGRSRPLTRAIGLGGLLVGELVVLAWHFESAPLKQSSYRFVAFLGEEGVLPLGVAIAAATALLASAGNRSALRAAAEQIGGRRAWAPLALTQVAAFLLFYHATALVLARTGSGAPVTPAIVASWLSAGGLMLGLWVLTLLPWRAVRTLVRPLGLLVLAGTGIGFVAWAVSFETRELWWPLGYATARLVRGFFNLLGVEQVTGLGELTLGTPQFAVEVSPACSGYQGIGLILVFTSTYLWVCRRTLRFPRAFLLLAVGTALMFFANAVRIAALVAIGSWLSPEVAVGGFHSAAGALLFSAIALGMVYAAERSSFLSVTDSRKREVMVSPTAAHLVPLLAVVGTAMVTGALTADGFDALYPLRVVAAGAALWLYRQHYRELRWTWSWFAVGTGLAMFGAWVLLGRGASGGEAADGFERALVALPPSWAAVWLGWRILGAVVTVPLAEELAFRGYLLRRLVAHDFQAVSARRFSWVGLLVSSLAFGALHGRLLAGTLAGMCYALAYRRRGELADAVVAHAATNAALAVWVMTVGSWSDWG
jgi:exosortase E/protease (VPEID-CTERM system)